MALCRVDAEPAHAAVLSRCIGEGQRVSVRLCQTRAARDHSTRAEGRRRVRERSNWIWEESDVPICARNLLVSSGCNT